MYGTEVRCTGVLVGKPEGKNHLQNLDVDERMMLRTVLEIVGWRHGMD
jgi:hypothetical protein